MTKRAYFVLSGNGGVGKSALSIALADHFRNEGIATACHDGDSRVGRMRAAMGIKGEDGAWDPVANKDALAGCASFDARDPKAVSAVSEALVDAARAERMVFDMPGGSVEDLRHVYGDMGFLFKDFRDQGFEVHAIIVVSPLRSSAAGVGAIMNEWRGADRIHAAKSLALADAGDFLFFDGIASEEANGGIAPCKAIQSAGGAVLEIPRLAQDTFALVEAIQAPYSAVRDGKAAIPFASLAGATRTHRQRCAFFLQKCAEQFSCLGE